MKRKVIKSAIIRGGLILMFMGISLYFTQKTGDPKQTQSMIAATIIATSVAAFSTIYDYDVWSVKKKIMVHTLCMFLTVYPALIISGWFDTSQPSGYVIALASFITFGIIFASIGYLVSKYFLKNVPESKKK